ncbi:glycosyltransferase family 2 protein [Flavobacterium foetidum]|uniref:glycosyltransferase family 2 protein n=1 Tax=Flavobacterium foetidum TaxID=2026681 RepID=UPI001074E92F|nr:glycosyltransferase family A protein [Flavobacterium foetidum]KAF2513554.1 glycosyltransferase family 2 protein [Flavobacterium foetidum]
MIPLISIIIPAYNRAHIIHETLESICEQSYQNWECIIVDDGSTDNTNQIVNHYIEKDSRFQFYNRPSDRLKGANACRNFGLEKSKGEYVMFLDSDDVCESFCLEERASIVSGDFSIDLLVRDTAYFIDNVKQLFSINKDPETKNSENYLSMFLRYKIPWPIMACLYKKSSIGNCRFDENLKRFQDLSFNIRVLSQSKKVKIHRDFKIDNYYRDDKQKILSPSFIKNIYESLNVFHQIHRDLLANRNYKLEFRKFNSKIIIQFVMPYFYQNRKESNKFLFWTIKSNIFAANQKLAVIMTMLFLNTGLFKMKGIGMNRLRNKFKKSQIN